MCFICITYVLEHGKFGSDEGALFYVCSGVVPCDLPTSQLPTCAQADGKMKRRLQEMEQEFTSIPHFSIVHHARGLSLVDGGFNDVVQKAMVKEYFRFDPARGRLYTAT